MSDTEATAPLPPFDPAGGHQNILNQIALEIGDITVQLRDIGKQFDVTMRRQQELEERRRELTEQASAIAKANRAVRGA